MCDNDGAAGRCYQHLYPGLTPTRKGLAMEATRICSAPQCADPSVKLGLCSRHYQRKRNTGSTADGRRPLPVDVRPGEQWLPVPGYEGIYEVSDQGRVKSVARTSRHSGASVKMSERMLRLGNERYQTVRLCKDGWATKHYVHTLVLLAFVGPCANGMEALHNDDDGHNNRLSNLRWGTHAENGADRWRNERLGGRLAAKVAKLTVEQVRDARAAAARGERQLDIARRMGVSRSAIGLIVHGRNWAHLPDDEPMTAP